MIDPLIINTQTTGFGSPARAYVSKRLDTNELLIDNPYTTFFFKWEGESVNGLLNGDYIIVDREKIPKLDDLVVYSSDKLKIDFYKNINPEELWGVITWKLCQIRK